MDATGRLTYRLLNRDTRAKVRHRGLFHGYQLAGFLLGQTLSTRMSHFIYFLVIVSGEIGCFL